MEVAAFWVALASVLIMAGWFKSRTEAQKHQTFRTIVEKTGTVDEAQLKLLLDPPGALAKTMGGESSRGDSYRFFRGLGAVLMFVAGGILFFSGVVLGMLFPDGGGDPALRVGPSIGMGAAGFVFLLGCGVFFASRFAEKPLPEKNVPAGSGKE